MAVNIHFLTLFVGFEWTEAIIKGEEREVVQQKFHRKEVFHW